MQRDSEYPKRDWLTPAQRIGEVFAVLMLLLLYGFFSRHQTLQTGFFRETFGQTESLLLFGTIFFGMFAPLCRVVTSRRNLSRPIEAVSNLLVAAAAVHFLNVSPFNFTHLADALPSALQFALAWMTNDIGRVILILQAIIGPVAAVFLLGKFALVALRDGLTAPQRRLS